MLLDVVCFCFVVLKTSKKTKEEAPAEFRCELMDNLMEDPVKLPSGKICCFFGGIVF
jgi:hypothetical protein